MIKEYTYIYKPNKLNGYYLFRSKSEFFNQSLRWKFEEDYLYLYPAGLDDLGKNVLYPRWDSKINRYVFGISLALPYDLPSGNYLFDEDSSEDEVIIFLG